MGREPRSLKPMSTLPNNEFKMNTSKTDRRLGALVHIASIPAPYAGPLIALVVAGGRPFVRYQAVRALVGQVLAGLLTFVVIATSLSITIYQLVQTGFDLSEINWWQVLIKSVVVWLALVLFGLWNTLTALREAFVAHQGNLPRRMRWPDRVAARVSGLPRGS